MQPDNSMILERLAALNTVIAVYTFAEPHPNFLRWPNFQGNRYKPISSRLNCSFIPLLLNSNFLIYLLGVLSAIDFPIAMFQERASAGLKSVSGKWQIAESQHRI